ncbi:MAG: thiolase family protein, partial [Bacilli bacterium]
MENHVYIVASKRLAIGGFNKSLQKYSAVDLALPLVNDLLNQTNVKPSDIDEVIVGNVLNAGTKQGLARQIILRSDLDPKTCGHVISMVCGSGLKAINDAYTKIKAQEASIIIAGGSESMSNAPYLLNQARNGFKYGNKKVIDSILSEALVDAIHGIHMGETAENIATKYQITQAQQDLFALDSINKAIKATQNGYFNNEILPFVVKQKNQEIIFDQDEHIKYDSSLEKLSTLKTVFKEGGSVTAGNASGINDGAAFVMIANHQALIEYDLEPQA